MKDICVISISLYEDLLNSFSDKRLCLSEKELVLFNERKTTKRKAAYLAGNAAVKFLYNKASGEYADCIEVLRDDKGPPYLFNNTKNICSSWNISISYCKNYAVASISKNKIGIDIQEITDLSYSASMLIFTEKEISAAEKNKKLLLQFWSIKEAVLKAIGEGLNINPLYLEVEIISNSFKVNFSQELIDKGFDFADKIYIKSEAFNNYFISYCEVL